MYNKCIFVGNLTRDIELRYLPSGAAVAKCAIATSHKYKSQNGEQKDEVCFMDFDIFGRVAEVANQYLKKGSKVLLEGRIVFEQWTAQDGSTRSRHKLRVEVMKMLDGKKEGESYSTDDNNGGYDQGGYDNYNNQGQGNYNPNQAQGNYNPNQAQGNYNPNQAQAQQRQNPNQGQGQGNYNPNQAQAQQRQNPNQGQGQGQGQGNYNPNQAQAQQRQNPNQGQGQGYNPNPNQGQGQGYNPNPNQGQGQGYNPQSQSSFNGNNGRMPEIDIDEDEIPF